MRPPTAAYPPGPPLTPPPGPPPIAPPGPTQPATPPRNWPHSAARHPARRQSITRANRPHRARQPECPPPGRPAQPTPYVTPPDPPSPTRSQSALPQSAAVVPYRLCVCAVLCVPCLRRRAGVRAHAAPQCLCNVAYHYTCIYVYSYFHVHSALSAFDLSRLPAFIGINEANVGVGRPGAAARRGLARGSAIGAEQIPLFYPRG